jgi:hypothetical protein
MEHIKFLPQFVNPKFLVFHYAFQTIIPSTFLKTIMVHIYS